MLVKHIFDISTAHLLRLVYNGVQLRMITLFVQLPCGKLSWLPVSKIYSTLNTHYRIVSQLPCSAASLHHRVNPGVWRPSGTRDTSRRRWKDWWGCLEVPASRWSGRTNSRSRCRICRLSSKSRRLYGLTSTRWIHSRSSVTSPKRHVLLCSRWNWLQYSPETASAVAPLFSWPNQALILLRLIVHRSRLNICEVFWRDNNWGKDTMTTNSFYAGTLITRSMQPSAIGSQPVSPSQVWLAVGL